MKKITRLIRVVDTRQYEEGPDDRCYPIPGSGNSRCCDRCGRAHEVHAHVLLEGGEMAVVGVGCAGADDIEMASRFKKADGLAKRLAALDRKEEAFLARRASWEAVWTEVAGLPVPEVKEEACGDGVIFRVGAEGYARAFGAGFRESAARTDEYRKERIACAVTGWRSARMVERGAAATAPHAGCVFSVERAKIHKAMRALGLEVGEAAAVAS